MAKKKKVVDQGPFFEPNSAVSPPVVNTDWAEPELPEVEPVAKAPKTYQIKLLGNYLHAVSINGTVHQYRGGELLTVAENIYHILKEANLIKEEITQ